MRAPIGVVFVGVMAIFAGLLDLLEGAQMLGIVVFGPVPAGDGRILAGGLVAFVGLCWIAVGAGAFSLKSWAWIALVLVAIFALFQSIMLFLVTLSWEYALAAAIFPSIVLWYLSRDRIQVAFGIEDKPV
jgi:hypothetical protein